MPSIDVHSLVAVALIFAFGVMSPGPNFMVIAQRSVARGRADGLATMLGVVTVSGIWAAGSLFGIGLLFAMFPWARLAFRIVGAAYLIWLGARMWRNARIPMDVTSGKTGGGNGFWRAYRAGLATNFSNAKAIAFYSSAFSAAAPTSGQEATLWLALALVLVIAMVWYGFVAIALSSGPVAAAYRRAKAPIERSCGLLMIGFGGRLAAG
jgi:threonine/homoserine/homoserine lactone efflux protein